MNISKDKFTEVMRFIKNILECQVKVEKLYREYGLFDTPIDTAPTQAVELLIDLLSITTNDKKQWIRWYVETKYCGPSCVFRPGPDIDSIEELYDFLYERYEENE